MSTRAKFLTPFADPSLQISFKDNILTPETFFQTLKIQWLTFPFFSSQRLYNKTIAWCQKNIILEKLDPQWSWWTNYYSRELREGKTAPLEISWINNILGYGLFAKRDIPGGSFIAEYTGEIRPKWKTWFSTNDYLWEYGTPYHQKSPFLIDAKTKGNYTRFINHSTIPNSLPCFALCNGLLRIFFRNPERIHKGEQITTNYGPNYWRTRELVPNNE